MTALNAPGEDEDMRSGDEVMRFDPGTSRWSAMPSLPEGRSSHDAVVMGDKIYVAGGWKLEGGSETAAWHDSAWALDLSASDRQWRELPKPPFQRRALALAAAGGRLFVLGGFTPSAVTSSDVFVFDPSTQSWTSGVSLPIDGFGMSAYGIGDEVYVSGKGGEVFSVGAYGTEWRSLAQLSHPRIFHRLVAAESNALLAVGGAEKGGHVRNIERIELGVRDR
jgi:N-acetylneuraminic acid mutarotase